MTNISRLLSHISVCIFGQSFFLTQKNTFWQIMKSRREKMHLANQHWQIENKRSSQNVTFSAKRKKLFLIFYPTIILSMVLALLRRPPEWRTPDTFLVKRNYCVHRYCSDTENKTSLIYLWCICSIWFIVKGKYLKVCFKRTVLCLKQLTYWETKKFKGVFRYKRMSIWG